MNQQLAKTILESFGADISGLFELPKYSDREWKDVLVWLDTTGLSLYFLSRLKSLGKQDVLPPSILQRFETNFNANRAQQEEQFAEFSAIIQIFNRNSIRFAAEKGFTVEPDYCPDTTLRVQLDLDFRIHHHDLERAHDLLRARGYSLLFDYPGELKLARGDGGIPSLERLYSPKRQWHVELHWNQVRPWPVVETVSIRGLAVPVLSKLDVFRDQCAHVFRHLRSEWTRASWLLEFRHFVLGNQDNDTFWTAIQRSGTQDAEAAVALSSVTEFAEGILGPFASPILASIREEALPPALRKWISRYAWPYCLARFPGTKYYLLLERELTTDRTAWRRQCRQRLLPLHAPPRAIQAEFRKSEASGSLLGYLGFVFQRLKLHSLELPRFAYEYLVWTQMR
jgi:hypothetical protein